MTCAYCGRRARLTDPTCAGCGAPPRSERPAKPWGIAARTGTGLAFHKDAFALTMAPLYVDAIVGVSCIVPECVVRIHA